MNRSTLLTFVFAIVAIVIGLASAREAQYFYNSVSGEATWTDPLIAPWIDEETGKKYWTTADGTATWESPGNWKEEWSTEHKMPFYVNKKTSESTWDLPEELAWKRVNHEVEDTL
ncbi:unnamed protein product [Bathycoccus prasinos]